MDQDQDKTPLNTASLIVQDGKDEFAFEALLPLPDHFDQMRVLNTLVKSSADFGVASNAVAARELLLLSLVISRANDVNPIKLETLQAWAAPNPRRLNRLLELLAKLF